VAKNTERIELEIEQARNQLASTLDELSVRANPQRLAGDAKHAVLDTFKQSRYLFPVVGGAAVIGGGLSLAVVVKLFRRIFRRR
jgi:hypothetical protein